MKHVQRIGVVLLSVGAVFFLNALLPLGAEISKPRFWAGVVGLYAALLGVALYLGARAARWWRAGHAVHAPRNTLKLVQLAGVLVLLWGAILLGGFVGGALSAESSITGSMLMYLGVVIYAVARVVIWLKADSK